MKSGPKERDETNTPQVSAQLSRLVNLKMSRANLYSALEKLCKSRCFKAARPGNPLTGWVPGPCPETKTAKESFRIQRHGEGAEMSVLILCCAGPREPGVRVSEGETSPIGGLRSKIGGMRVPRGDSSKLVRRTVDGQFRGDSVRPERTPAHRDETAMNGAQP